MLYFVWFRWLWSILQSRHKSLLENSFSIGLKCCRKWLNSVSVSPCIELPCGWELSGSGQTAYTQCLTSRVWNHCMLSLAAMFALQCQFRIASNLYLPGRTRSFSKCLNTRLFDHLMEFCLGDLLLKIRSPLTAVVFSNVITFNHS